MMTQRKTLLGSLVAAAVSVASTTTAFAEAPSFSGFIDFGYNYNLNGMRTNVLRSFDANANSFTLQNAELVAEGKAPGDVAYRVDLAYGNDPSVFNYAGANVGDLWDFEQAFLSVACPLTKGTFTVGKFVTPFGAEVIEAKDNFNTSRGHLFNYAIPLHHTGVKYDKAFGDLSLTAGVVNGWDNVSDNSAVNGNEGKTLLAQVAKPFGDKWKVVLGGAYGPERPQTATSTLNGRARSLVDAVVAFNPTSKLSLVANYDWGVEEGAPTGFTPTAQNMTANWSGIAVLGKYALTDMFSIAARYENFDDEGSRTLTEQVLHSGTVTLECKKDNVITRLEVRQDNSTDMVYFDDNGAADDTQTTVGLQWIYAF